MLYEAMVAVRWHFVSDDQSWPERSNGSWAHLELSDDLGTEYVGRGAGGGRLGADGAGDMVVAGEDHFAPSPPTSVRRLTVHYANESFELDVLA